MNGVLRSEEILPLNDIKNKLKQKWVETAIKNTDVFRIVIYPQYYVDDYEDGGKWQVKNEGNDTIITLESSNGKKEVYDLNKIIQERDREKTKKELDLVENTIEQAKLIYLNKQFKDYECAFNHIVNRIDYEKKRLTNAGKQAQKEDD